VHGLTLNVRKMFQVRRAPGGGGGGGVGRGRAGPGSGGAVRRAARDGGQRIAAHPPNHATAFPPKPQELDEQLFEECQQRWEEEEEQHEAREEARRQQWADVAREATKRAAARGMPKGAGGTGAETYTPLLVRGR
jgi:hypothetical protein